MRNHTLLAIGLATAGGLLAGCTVVPVGPPGVAVYGVYEPRAVVIAAAPRPVVVAPAPRPMPVYRPAWGYGRPDRRWWH